MGLASWGEVGFTEKEKGGGYLCTDKEAMKGVD